MGLFVSNSAITRLWPSFCELHTSSAQQQRDEANTETGGSYRKGRAVLWPWFPARLRASVCELAA
jgi:hypothetical protein